MLIQYLAGQVKRLGYTSVRHLPVSLKGHAPNPQPTYPASMELVQTAFKHLLTISGTHAKDAEIGLVQGWDSEC